ncbi:MAG: FdhF/YdeP family oxidoreductase [Flavobacteriaceae bacterium]
MALEFKRKVSITGDTSFTGIKLQHPERYAAGLAGIQHAMRHAFREMGVVRAMRSLGKMNQQQGFDCPSCAWPDPEHPSKIAEYCENGAKALADEATTQKIGANFFAQHSVEALSQLTDFELNRFGRLVEPLVLRPGKHHYEPISWENAFDVLGDTLRKLDHPDEAIFYTSGRSSNEAAFLYGMFARALGTNNMPDCSNMCHESSGKALGETLGIGKGSVTLEDLHEAEVIIVAGQNPGTNHPRMLAALEKCKENGGKIISINPLEEAGLVAFRNPKTAKGLLAGGEHLTDLHLQVPINQDIPLLKLIVKKLKALDEGKGHVFDHAFLTKKVQGLEELMADLDQHSHEALLQQCGIPEVAIDQAVEWLASSSKIIVCWAMGLTQHQNGVATIREYINLLLLKGAIGKRGAGTCPVRGHSNVQGDRSVGIMHFVDKGLNQRIKENLGFEPPQKEGVDTVGAIQAMHGGKAKVFICLGGNFLMAAPDTFYTAQALQRCELTVQVSTKLNRSHLVTGKTALILPTLGRSEKDEKEGKLRTMTMESSMGRVRQSKGLLRPTSNGLMSEPEIIGRMAHAYFQGKHPVDWLSLGNDYDLIRAYIDKVAKGFDRTTERSKGKGYYLPNNARMGDFSNLPNGRALLTINPVPNHRMEKEELMLMTIRSHDQFNTTIYGLNDRYRGIHNERRVVFMNTHDMAERGLKKRDVVHLTSTYAGQVREALNFLVVPYNIPRGNVAAYFPETNPLVPIDQVAEGSGTPISKSVRVKVHRTR